MQFIITEEEMKKLVPKADVQKHLEEFKTKVLAAPRTQEDGLRSSDPLISMAIVRDAVLTFCRRLDL